MAASPAWPSPGPWQHRLSPQMAHPQTNILCMAAGCRHFVNPADEQLARLVVRVWNWVPSRVINGTTTLDYRFTMVLCLEFNREVPSPVKLRGIVRAYVCTSVRDRAHPQGHISHNNGLAFAPALAQLPLTVCMQTARRTKNARKNTC